MHVIRLLMYISLVREPSVPKRDRDGKLILSYALLKCQARSDLLALRAAFTQDVTSLIGEMPSRHDLLQQLMLLLHDQR